MSRPDFAPIVETEARADRLAAFLGELYGALGALAPRMTSDRLVVVCYETSRVLGEAREALVALAPTRTGAAGTAEGPGALRDCLVAAVAEDPTGALAVAALCSLLLPRLLVDLRDAAVSGPEAGPLARAARRAADEVVERLTVAAEALSGLPPVERGALGRLRDTLEAQGLDGGTAPSR